jgi:hypothetical protein
MNPAAEPSPIVMPTGFESSTKSHSSGSATASPLIVTVNVFDVWPFEKLRVVRPFRV